MCEEKEFCFKYRSLKKSFYEKLLKKRLPVICTNRRQVSLYNFQYFHDINCMQHPLHSNR